MGERNIPVIVISRKGCFHYRSIKSAADALGVSKQKLLRDLASESGAVFWEPEQVFIDYDLPKDEV